MSPSLAILILAQAVSATPAAVPDDGPPPPSIVERIGGPVPSPTATVPKAAPAAPPPPAALPVPKAAPKPAAARANDFGVHVGSYRRSATAEGEVRRLGGELALPVRVLRVDLGAKGVWYRVVVGEAGSAAEASALRDRLKQRGIPDGVVQSFPR